MSAFVNNDHDLLISFGKYDKAPIIYNNFCGNIKKIYFYVNH